MVYIGTYSQGLPLHWGDFCRAVAGFGQPVGRGNLAPTIGAHRQIMDTPYINVNTPVDIDNFMNFPHLTLKSQMKICAGGYPSEYRSPKTVTPDI